MRRCNISPPSCRHEYSTPCCKDCKDTGCASRCLNNPERCGCWADRPPSQRKGRWAKLDRGEILRLRGQGLLQREIAERLGCSTSGVSAALHEREASKHGKS